MRSASWLAGRLATGVPVAGRKVSSPGRNAAHCPARPLQRQGRSLRSRRQGDGSERPPLTPETCRPSGPDSEGHAEGQARKRAVNLSLLLYVPHGRVQVEVTRCSGPRQAWKLRRRGDKVSRTDLHAVNGSQSLTFQVRSPRPTLLVIPVIPGTASRPGRLRRYLLLVGPGSRTSAIQGGARR